MKILLTKLIKITLSAIVLLSSPIFAQVVLHIDDNIKVVELNGQAVNTSMFRSPQMSYTLPEGKHMITARYDRIYKLGGDNHDYLKSANISLTTDLVDGQTYKLVMPNQPEMYHAAKAYSQNPTLAIQSANTLIATAQPVNNNKTSMKLFSKDILSSIGDTLFTQQDDARIHHQKTINSTVQLHSSRKTLDKKDVSTSLDAFIKIWRQSTPEERKEIRSWIKDK